MFELIAVLVVVVLLVDIDFQLRGSNRVALTQLQLSKELNDYEVPYFARKLREIGLQLAALTNEINQWKDRL